MSTSDERIWLIRTDAGISGPFSLDQLRNMARNGSLSRTTPIKTATSSNWSVASQFPAIFSKSTQTTQTKTDTPTPRDSRPLQPPTVPASANATGTGRLAPPPITPRIIATGPTSQQRPPGIDSRGIVPMGIDPTFLATGLIGAAVLVGLTILVVTISRLSVRPATPIAAASQETSATSKLQTQSTTRTPIHSTEELVARTQASVTIVATPSGSGSGFMITPNVLATNYHVIADAPSDSLQVFFPDATDQKRGPFAASIVRESPDRDLALLRIDVQVPALELDQNYSFRRGQDVVIIGSPSVFRGESILSNAVTKGVLSSETTLYGHDVHQLSLAVNPGNSGGPVIGMDGRVIGVVVAKSLSEESIGFSIPAAYLATLMQEEAVNGYAVSRDAFAMHDARALVRGVTEQILEREGLFSRFIDDANIQPSTESAVDFVTGWNKVLAKEFPELTRSFNRDFEELTSNAQLSSSLRRDLSLLHARQQAIESLLDAPPAKLDRFMNDLSRLNDQYLRQLKVLNRSLEIGRPELFVDD